MVLEKSGTVVFLQVCKMKNQYNFIHVTDNHYEVM